MIVRQAAWLVAATLVLLGNASASAATTTSCADEIVDGAAVLSPADLTTLTQGSAALAAKTQLRIRTVSSVPGKDLNAYEKTLQISCGWASAANVRQPRLLVVMVDTQDRQMGIYPGTAISGTIDKPVWLSIEQHTMRPRLAEADWAGGLQQGVNALNALLSGAPAPAVAAKATSATTWWKHIPSYAYIAAAAIVANLVLTRRRFLRRRAFYDNNPTYVDPAGPHHGGWGWGGGGGGGFDGGGGGSSSDGGGGSSGF